MYRPLDLALFAIAEFERGLEGLTEEEAVARPLKADGTEMNAISWTVAHIAGQWLNRPPHLARYEPGSTDPTPPTLAEAVGWLREGRALVERWLPRAGDDLLLSVPGGNLTGGETVGTAILRATLHSWFHTGEINAMRQMLGHKEIPYVGQMIARMEWRP